MTQLQHEYVRYLLSLNRAQFTAIRKAVNTLLRLGVDFDTAISIVLDAHRMRFERMRRIA